MIRFRVLLAIAAAISLSVPAKAEKFDMMIAMTACAEAVDTRTTEPVTKLGSVQPLSESEAMIYVLDEGNTAIYGMRLTITSSDGAAPEAWHCLGTAKGGPSVDEYLADYRAKVNLFALDRGYVKLPKTSRSPDEFINCNISPPQVITMVSHQMKEIGFSVLHVSQDYCESGNIGGADGS